jgi:hypothetical protein
MSNLGKTVYLQFGNGMHGLTIQLLHGQILKIIDWRATGILSLIDLDVRPERECGVVITRSRGEQVYIYLQV